MKLSLGSYFYTAGRVLVAATILFGLLLAVPATQTRADNAGYALAFDGINDLVRLTYTASIMATSTWTTTKSVELWVKPEGPAVFCANNVVAACDYIFGDRPEWWGITRGIINGLDRIWIFNFDGRMKQIGVTYTTGEWVHIALVHNNGMLRAYVNGVETGAVASGATRQPGNGALPMLYIGGSIFNTSRNYTLQGQIDEVRIWNIARSTAEIVSNKDLILTGSEAGLAAYYQMSDGAGTILTDDSVNNWNGTLLDGELSVPPNGSYPQWVTSNAFGDPTPTPTFTPVTPTASPGPPTATPTETFTPTWTPVVPTATPTDTPEPSPTPTLTWTPTDTFTPTNTPEPSLTPEPSTPTNMPDPTLTPEPSTPTPTWTPVPSATPAGSSNFALSFDGANDLVQLPATSQIIGASWTSTKSVELWVKPEGASIACANNAIAACDIIIGDRPQLWGLTRGVINGQDRIWAFNYDGSMDIISMTYTPNEWMHVALVHSDGMLRLFRNGVEVASRASGNTAFPQGSNPVLSLGGIIFSSTSNYTLQGQIDEVRLWNVARSAQEIQNDMLRMLTGDEAWLAAYYLMSDGAGSTLTDDSIYNWNGTLLDGGWGVAPNGTLPLWVIPGAF